MIKSVRAIINFNSNFIVKIFPKLIDHDFFCCCSDCSQQMIVVFMLVVVTLAAPHPEAQPEAAAMPESKPAIAYAYNYAPTMLQMITIASH